LFPELPVALSPRLASAREIAFQREAERRRLRPPTIILDGEQVEAGKAIMAFLASAAPGDCFTLHGLAGTGKTSVMAELARQLRDAGRDVILVAPTGKAAAVLARKTGTRAQTLHGLLYGRPDDRGHWASRWPDGSLEGSIVMVDEASMVAGTLGRDLVATGAAVVASGDPGQLPPVKGDAFFPDADFTLTEIRRQAADRPIIRQAHRVRTGADYEDDGEAFRLIRERSDENYGWADVVLCYRNETRHKINRFLRARRGIPRDLEPRAGEPVICLRNDHFAGVMNGETFVLAAGFVAEQPLRLVNGPTIERAWFEPHHGEEHAPWRCTPFGLAYAITVHKSQGSEWSRVLIVDECDGPDRMRWLYTAITRASAEVRIVRRAEA
jgi:exodeoxyribonuclease-5